MSSVIFVRRASRIIGTTIVFLLYNNVQIYGKYRKTHTKTQTFFAKPNKNQIIISIAIFLVLLDVGRWTLGITGTSILANI